MTAVTLSPNMKVVTRWPALVPAIIRAGHEPVVVDSDGEVSDTPLDYTTFVTGTNVREADLPEPSVTARPRGAQRYPR